MKPSPNEPDWREAYQAITREEIGVRLFRLSTEKDPKAAQVTALVKLAELKGFAKPEVDENNADAADRDALSAAFAGLAAAHEFDEQRALSGDAESEDDAAA